MISEKKRFIIIDANSVIHRAYHALPPLTTKGGELVNAVYGFLLVFFRAIREFQPNYIAACFDLPVPTFRHQKFKEYKANRPPTPRDLVSQIPKIKKVLEAFSVQIFEKQGFEADDIIGTLATLSLPKGFQFSKKENLETIIISGDLDTLQLVTPHTNVYALRKGVKDTVLYDENLVKEKYGGLTSGQLVDFKALRGDPSDNIPGVRGVGEKTAIELLNKFGRLENLYEEIQEPKGKISISAHLKNKLLEQKENAFLSKWLAQIKKDVPIDFNLEECQLKEYDTEKVIKILKHFEFQSLIERLPDFKRTEKGGKIGVNPLDEGQKALF